MGSPAQLAVIRSLIAFSSEPDAQDRADAGRCLATFADEPEAWAPLLALLLDAEDTYPTLHTALGLLRRDDRAGLRVIAAALATAHDDSKQWIDTAINEVLGIYATELRQGISWCRSLEGDPDEGVRIGSAVLLEILEAIDPIMYPAEEAAQAPNSTEN